LQVSAIGLGTVKLGRDQGVKYPSEFCIPSDREARELLAQALDLGINLIDTAPAYGNSEQRLGHLLAGRRKDWLICSKVGEEFDNGVSQFDFSPEHVQASVQRSLERLRCEVIDLVLVHSDGNDLDIIQGKGTLEALAALKQAGIIRAFGMSTKTVAGGIAAAGASDVVMLTHNLDYRDELPVLDECARLGKGALIKKALASGHLLEGIDDPIQASMALLFEDAAVSAAIIGTITPVHLAANVAAARRVTG